MVEDMVPVFLCCCVWAGAPCALSLSTTPAAAHMLYRMFTEGYFYYYQRPTMNENERRVRVYPTFHITPCFTHSYTTHVCSHGCDYAPSFPARLVLVTLLFFSYT